MKKIFTLLAVCSATVLLKAQDVSFTILHNNDGESQIIDAGSGVEEFGGAARFLAKKNQLASQAQTAGKQVITLSSGDNFLAGPEFSAGVNRSNGLPLFDAEVLAAINYDAICLGNHDYDFGPQVLAGLINDVKSINQTPFLSANSDFSNEPSLIGLKNSNDIASGIILTKGGVKVGIIGATTPQLKNISSPGGVVVLEDVATAVQTVVNDYVNNQGVQVVILIAHLQGIDEDLQLIPLLSNVDVVIAGGGDELLGDAGTALVPSDTVGGASFYGTYPLVPTDKDGKTVYTVTTPGEYKYVGQLNFTYNVGTDLISSIDANSKLVRVASTVHPDGIAPDPTLQTNVVDSVALYLDNLALNVIATKNVDLDGTRDNVRNNETNLGNLVADAMLWQANELASTFAVPMANIGVQNGGGIRNNTIIGGTELTELNTFDILPFSNIVTLVEGVTPSILKELLENFVSVTRGGSNAGSGRFGQIAGFKFVYDTLAQSLEYDNDGNIITQGERVVNVTLNDGTEIINNGQVVAGAPNVNLAIADFSAKGGDQYPLGDLKRTQLGATYQRALYNYVVSPNGLNGNILAAQYPTAGEGRISFGSITSISEIEKNTLKAYPNPSNGFVKIVLNEGNSANLVEVADASGQVVATFRGIDNTLEINCKNFTNGMYLVKIHSNDGMFYSRFVKN